MRLMRALVVLALLAPHASHAGTPGATRGGEVTMTVQQVKVVRGNHVVLLQTKGGGRVLPIWIGQREAQAIQMRMSGTKARRPLTHDLLEIALSTLKARIVKVQVDALRDSVFHGKLTLASGKRRHRIDGRPSDLITLAVGAGLPIHVAREVLDKAGLSPEQPSPPAEGKPGPQEI